MTRKTSGKAGATRFKEDWDGRAVATVVCARKLLSDYVPGLQAVSDHGADGTLVIGYTHFSRSGCRHFPGAAESVGGLRQTCDL